MDKIDGATSQAVQDITQCSICMESFKDPKCLPCIHTFCLKCLETYGKNKRMGDQVPCPICRKVFNIPARGFNELPSNHFINQLLHLNEITYRIRTDQGLKCEVCLDSGLKEPFLATAYCIECGQPLCEPCQAMHQKYKFLRRHTITSLNAKPSSADLIKHSPSYCDRHPNKEIDFYCYDCKTNACVLCYVAKHSKHNCSDVKESAEKFKEGLNDDVSNIASCIRQGNYEKRKLEETKKSLHDEVSRATKRISEKYGKLRSILDSHQSELMAELKSFEDQKMKELETRQDEVERLSLVQETFKGYCMELIANATPCNLTRAADDLHRRAEELVIIQKKYNCTQLSSADIKFKSSATYEQKAKNSIGRLSFKSQ